MSKASENARDIKKICVQALLNRHWVTKTNDPELFNHIRTHYEELREWFQEYCGFSLLLTRQFAKLEKVPGKAQNWMGWDNFIDPRDYALFTYCLWYLEGKNEMEQFLLTDMVEEIREYLTGVNVFVDWTLYAHRQSMARALKQLKSLGALIAVDGDEFEWARSGNERNVLYESSYITRYILRRFPQDLTLFRDQASLEEGLYPDTQEGQLKRRRHRVYRRLLQEAVVHDRQWSEDERYYVRTQRHTILENLWSFAGLEGQRYREGLLFYYPENSGEMYLFPTARAVSDICLLLAGELRRLLADNSSDINVENDGRVGMTMAELEGMLWRLREKYKILWSRQHREAKSSELALEVIGHLEEWGLGQREEDGRIWLYPALARWKGNYDINGDEA